VSKDTEAMVDLKQWTEDNVCSGWQSTLYDRHRLISEPIYGSILRQKFEPGFDNFAWLYSMNYAFYTDVKPLIIYCIPPYPVVYDNIKDDENNTRVQQYIRKIYAQYVSKAANDCVLHGALRYDYTQGQPIKDLITNIRYILDKRDGRLTRVQTY
jgi:hypothetical protein